MKKSEIKFTITLDEISHPETIQWEAENSGTEGLSPCNAVMISLFDSNDKATFRIDLWTKKMFVEDMQRFFYESFASMADTYERATNEKEVAADIRHFASHFGKKTGVLK